VADNPAKPKIRTLAPGRRSKDLSRAPVGGLRFTVKSVTKGGGYKAEAGDRGQYVITASRSKPGVVKLKAPDGTSIHSSIDEAETAAARHDRLQRPLEVPKLKWKKMKSAVRPYWRRYHNNNEAEVITAAEVCDLPFYGTGHFVIPQEWGEWGVISFAGAKGVQGTYEALSEACGIVDPYGYDDIGQRWKMREKAQIKGLIAILNDAANRGRNFYRVYPYDVFTDDDFLAGARRQVYAWSWFDARSRYHEMLHDPKLDAPHQAGFDRLMPGGYEPGQPAFYPDRIVDGLKSGPVSFPAKKAHELPDEDVGFDIGEDIAEDAVNWYGLKPVYQRQRPRRSRLEDGKALAAWLKRRVDQIAGSLVEVVEHNDGDEPYVRSLGVYAPRNAKLPGTTEGDPRLKNLLMVPQAGGIRGSSAGQVGFAWA